ncbi:MAG TPA: shikimate kinase [Phototrophicaceae bacterium]|nr:shikimate kinase [Phototrophicaceae bacterium]
MATPDQAKHDERNIVVTGFMATGKTTVGRYIASLIKRRFVDADDVIIERAEMSIPEMFAVKGEAAFRALEKEVCRDLTAERGLVIATGGGMLVDSENRRWMLDSGFVVCLDADPEVLDARLSGATDRPLAGDWRALLEKRHAVYAEIPIHVDTSDKTPAVLAQEIIGLWRASR